MLLHCFLVGVGGFIGALCRYVILLLPVGSQGTFPVKILCINVLGCFVLSIIAGAAIKYRFLPSELVIMLQIGVCGGFTAFSAMVFETVTLAKDGQMAVAITYIFASVILSLAAFLAGQALMK